MFEYKIRKFLLQVLLFFVNIHFTYYIYFQKQTAKKAIKISVESKKTPGGVSKKRCEKTAAGASNLKLKKAAATPTNTEAVSNERSTGRKVYTFRINKLFKF